MREIKFRAYDPEIKTICYGSLTQDRWYSKTGFLDVSSGGLDGCEIMQFTGLKDQNGKDIYFGDQVEYQTTEGTFHKAFVLWSDELCCIIIGEMPYPQLYQSAFIQPSKVEFEIIGNIYENNIV